MNRLALALWYLVLGLGSVSAQGTEYDTDHYTLHTDLGRSQVRDLQRFLEAMHATYEDVFPHDPVRENGRPVVRVFAAQADYEAYGHADPDVAFNANWRGYFNRDANTLVSYRGSSLPDLFSILSHEGFHQFAWSHITPPDAQRLPDWYEEGLAEYFRSAAIRRGHLRHSDQPHHIARVSRAIREDWVWTLDQLWDCDPARISDPLVFDAFYAHAHQFVSFLIDREREAVLRIYRRKREGADNDAIMAEIFGDVDPDRLHRAFTTWVTR